MIACMSRDPYIMGLCGETKIANKSDSWVTAIQGNTTMTHLGIAADLFCTL